MPIDVEMMGISLQGLSANVCYGTLYPAKAKFSSTEVFSTQPLLWSRFYTFELVARGDYYYLVHLNGKNSEIGMLDLVTTNTIRSLPTSWGLSFTAVLAASSVHNILGKRSNSKAIVDISVNIIGPESTADDVGATLANASAYLQHPFFLEARIRYINPQYFYSGLNKTDLRHLIGPLTTDSRSLRVSEGVESVLDSLYDPSGAGLSPGDTTVPVTIYERLIRSTLKEHQKDGVSFILNREEPSFCDSVTSDLKALIGFQFSPQNLTLCLGGIIADIMGLGKTLTMLSAIVCSKNMAIDFAKTDSGGTRPRKTRATLIVVTSRQVLDVWTSEIQKHLTPTALEYDIFHGDSRAKTTEALVDCDVVLTTYRTLSLDWEGLRILQDMGWFRVVLDEGHWIRNQSSKQFKAAKSLQAERRWCLTGTPIQNSLEDLRSLLGYLHFQPFASPAFFEKHIVEPLRSDSHNSFRNLKLLLRTICLRRNAGYLELPPGMTENVPITFTPEERAAYNKILEYCKAEYDRIVSAKSQIKKYSILFTTIMKLRRLCNHGTLQTAMLSCTTPSGKRRRLKKRQIPIDEEPFCEFCCREDEDTTAILDGLEMCPECSRRLGAQEDALSQPPVDRLTLTSPASSLAVSAPASGNYTPQYLSPSSPDSAFSLQGGHSSKLVAVSDNIEKWLNDSKSLVFTSWRSTLDLLGDMLKEKGIQFLQIDGRVGFSERSPILSRFREDPHMRVLLMSFETGAVGLTLTAADRVHIVEPQWNPSVEEQAIARVLRMGQTRPVTVIKYVTEKTVEQNILTIQQRKSQLAKISLDSGAESDTTGGLDDLKFVLSTEVE